MDHLRDSARAIFSDRKGRADRRGEVALATKGRNDDLKLFAVSSCCGSAGKREPWNGVLRATARTSQCAVGSIWRRSAGQSGFYAGRSGSGFAAEPDVWIGQDGAPAPISQVLCRQRLGRCCILIARSLFATRRFELSAIAPSFLGDDLDLLARNGVAVLRHAETRGGIGLSHWRL